MNAIFIISSILISFGFYLILISLFKLPTLRSISNYNNNVKKFTSSKKKSKFEIFISKIVKKILPENSSLLRKLNINLSLSEEEDDGINFITKSFSPCILLFLLYTPLSIIFFPVYVSIPSILLIALYPVYKVLNVMKKAENIRESITNESYTLVKYIANKLKSTNNVIDILSSFSSSNSSYLQKEISTILAQTKSVSFPYALKQFEDRIDSKLISDISKGLISSYQGEDMSLYFKMLEDNLSEYTLEQKEKKLDKLPSYIKLISIISLVLFTSTYFGIMYNLISSSLQTLFI